MSISNEIARRGVNTAHTKASRDWLMTARRRSESINVIEV
jgi:hypothetical protein